MTDLQAIVLAGINLRLAELTARASALRKFTLNRDAQFEAAIIDKQLEAIEDYKVAVLGEKP